MCQQGTPFATSDFSVSGLTVGTKIESIFLFQRLLRAKSVYGPNREMTQNVGTKSTFTPYIYC